MDRDFNSWEVLIPGMYVYEGYNEPTAYILTCLSTSRDNNVSLGLSESNSLCLSDAQFSCQRSASQDRQDGSTVLSGWWLEALTANQVEVGNNRKTGLSEIKYQTIPRTSSSISL